MAELGKKSTEILSKVHSKLKSIINEAIKEFDFSVIAGYRGCSEQDYLFSIGKSRKRFPYSNHNSEPARAVDIAPYPIDWKNEKRFVALSKIMKRIAKEKKINIVWGGDWGWDFPHYQLDDNEK